MSTAWRPAPPELLLEARLEEMVWAALTDRTSIRVGGQEYHGADGDRDDLVLADKYGNRYRVECEVQVTALPRRGFLRNYDLPSDGARIVGTTAEIDAHEQALTDALGGAT